MSSITASRQSADVRAVSRYSRCSRVVAHVGEELGLEPRGRQCRLACAHELGLVRLLARDVDHRADEAGHRPALVRDRGRARLHPALADARDDDPELAIERLAAAGRRVPAVDDVLAIVLVERRDPALVQALFVGHAEDLFPAPVHVDPPPVRVGLEDPDWRRHAERAEALLALPQVARALDHLLLDRPPADLEARALVRGLVHVLEVRPDREE
jgi:hypothetical protein